MHGLSFDKGPWFRFGFHRCLYIQGCFATGGAITVAASYMFFGKWVISERYMPLHWGAGWKVDWTSWGRLLPIQWSSSDMNFQPRGWLNTTCTIVTCSGLWLWDMWEIYEWYCYFIAKLYWEAWGLFWKRSVSLFLRGVRFFVLLFVCFLVGLFGFLFLFVCFCWLLLGCWMGDTLGIVSLYSHGVGMDNLNQWIDDRQSFERARHWPKKKKEPDSGLSK